VFAAPVGVADVMLAAREALPEVHEHLVLASLGKLPHDAGRDQGTFRVADGGGLVLQFSVRAAEPDIERAGGPAPPRG
jgi:hypothetical protein